MRIIKSIFLSLLALSLITGAGVFIFVETFNTDQYLPQISNKISLALGRPVSMGAVGLGFSSRGISLDGGPLTIADDPNFTAQPFIKIDRIRIMPDLKALIFQGKVRIREIILQSPQIHFIRSEDGSINARSIGQKSPSVKNGEQPALVKPLLPAIVADQSPVIPAKINGGQLPILFENQKNRELPPIYPTLIIQDASISYIDQNEAMPLDIWLRNVNARLIDFSFLRPFRLSFSASLYSPEPNVVGGVLISLPCLPNGKNTSACSAQINSLSLHVDLSRLNDEELNGISTQLKDSPLLKNIRGVVQLNLGSLDIRNSGDYEASGQIIASGEIKDFNIIKAALSPVLGFFEEMGANLDNLFNGQLKDKLNAKDTFIQQAEAKFAYHDKTLFISDSLVKTNILDLTAQGSVDQALNLDLQTVLHLNEDISAVLTDEFSGLKILYDNSNRIAIDATLKGTIPHLKYKPNKDFRKKSRKALMQEGGNILGVLLGGGQGPGEGQNASSPDQGKKKNKIKNLFKSLLR